MMINSKTEYLTCRKKLIIIFNVVENSRKCNRKQLNMERCPSGRRWQSRKLLHRKVPGVRISLSPPWACLRSMSAAGSSFFVLFYALFWGRFWCFCRNPSYHNPLSYKAFSHFDEEVCRNSLIFFKSSRLIHWGSVKHSVHYKPRFNLCMEVQMWVNIRCSWEGTVPKPYLDLLHGYTICQ